MEKNKTENMDVHFNECIRQLVFSSMHINLNALIAYKHWHMGPVSVKLLLLLWRAHSFFFFFSLTVFIFLQLTGDIDLISFCFRFVCRNEYLYGGTLRVLS